MPGGHYNGKAHMRRTAMPEKPPNDMRISCGPSCRRPHNPTFRFVLSGRGARAEPGHLRPVGCMRGLGGGPRR
jgi:hypothetical protein